MIEVKKILIVEDEAPSRGALEEKLTHEGFLVTTANNGEEGLAAVKKECPDLILLDIIMPKMDGITFLKKVRLGADCHNIPVIILSNLSDDEVVARALEEGTSDYLIKSDWTLEDIVAKIREKLLA